MKKIYLIAVFIFIALLSSAQSFQVRISETDTIVANNDTLFAAGNADDQDIKKHFEIENLTNSEITVRVVRENVNVPEGMNAVFCLNVCYAPNTTEADAVIPGESNQALDVDLWPQNVDGTAVVKMKLTNAAESEELVFYVEYAVAPAVGMNTLTDQISVYPNPVNDVLNVKFSGQDSQLQVFDAVGKLINEKNFPTNGKYQIDFSEMVSGIYLVRLMDNGKVIQTHKVMKY